MDLSHIPKSFWHSLSLSVFIVSVALSYTAYTAQSFTVEIANAKFQVANKALELEKINSQLKEQAIALEENRKQIEKKLLEAKSTNKKWAEAIVINPIDEARKIPTDQFNKNEEDLQKIKQSIERGYFAK